MNRQPECHHSVRHNLKQAQWSAVPVPQSAVPVLRLAVPVPQSAVPVLRLAVPVPQSAVLLTANHKQQ